jgi:hypothetical protein
VPASIDGGITKHLTKVPVGRPRAHDWFRVHPSPDFRRRTKESVRQSRSPIARNVSELFFGFLERGFEGAFVVTHISGDAA